MCYTLFGMLYAYQDEIMTQSTPSLRDGILTYQQQNVTHTIIVGTPAWKL